MSHANTQAVVLSGEVRLAGRALFPPLWLVLPPGKWTSLLGPSGAGQSTLLRLIAGLPIGGQFIGHIENRCPVALMAQDAGLLPWLTVRQNAAQRQWLSDRLTELGWRVYPSQTNFVFVDTGREAAPLADAARAAGFIIRAGAGWGYPGFLRISLGTPEQNAALVEVLKKVVDPAGKSTTSAN